MNFASSSSNSRVTVAQPTRRQFAKTVISSAIGVMAVPAILRGATSTKS